MKQRHIRINDDTHRSLARLSNELGVSMTAIVQIAVTRFADSGRGVKARKSTRYEKANIRSVRKAVAK